MKEYERVTQKQGEPKIVSKRVYYRLRELEDKIEDGTLVPKYSVVESCGTYYVCSVDTENLPVIDECETEEEAQKKLEELSKKTWQSKIDSL